ncbi:hypothetical protein APT63_09425 [Pseudomonas sp. 22-AL-CL-001]|nr:hypothetical protein APT63_09425 [Pseudomonas monteilii]
MQVRVKGLKFFRKIPEVICFTQTWLNGCTTQIIVKATGIMKNIQQFQFFTDQQCRPQKAFGVNLDYRRKLIDKLVPCFRVIGRT